MKSNINKVNMMLIRYPLLQSLISLIIIIIYNLLLNPNIVLAEFNWVNYTDTNPLPFDTWSAVYINDNPAYREVTNTPYETYIALTKESFNERELQARARATLNIEVFNELVNTYNKRVYTSSDHLVNTIGQYILQNKNCTLQELALLVPSIFKNPELYHLHGSDIEEQDTFKAFMKMCLQTENPRVIQCFAMYSAKSFTYNYSLTHTNVTPEQINGLYTQILAKILEKYATMFDVTLQ